MIGIYILTMFLVLYTGIVWASYLKFKYNGISLDMKYKLLLFILPVFILFMHSKLAIRIFKEDKKRSRKIFLIAFTKYPILVGNFIEVILESMAECDVYGDSRLLKKRKTKNKVSSRVMGTIGSMMINFEEIVNIFKREAAYENELLNGIV